MTFTDDDLLRVKEYCMEKDHIFLTNGDLEALLARLEAAEKVAKLLDNMMVLNGYIDRKDKVLKAWRKAAGK